MAHRLSFDDLLKKIAASEAFRVELLKNPEKALKGIGVDPTPRPIPPLGKVAMVFASLPLHAFFGVVLMSTKSVLGESFYESLQLYWHNDLLGDQRLGGGIAWAAGEVPLVVVMIALLVQWTRSDRRTARRLDRAADRDDDAELAAYNAMLAELARRDAR
jgi:putative copper resistance protein D